MANRIVLGVDIGGSHITAKLVDLNTGISIKESEVREPVNAKGTAEEIINIWCHVIDKSSGSALKNCKIGIAMPGPFDYEEGIAWMENQDKYDALYGLNVKQRIAERLSMPINDIKFINDAESFLKGEVFSGAAKNSSTAIGLTLGTGLGSAHYSHGAVDDANLWNSPFKNGIAEDYLSTRWFTKRYSDATGKQVSGVKELASYKNDVAVIEIFNEFGTNLGIFLNDMIAKKKADVIVIGGNIAHAFSLFQNKLFETFGDDGNGSSIKRAMLGEEASLIGAASCWKLSKDMVEASART